MKLPSFHFRNRPVLRSLSLSNTFPGSRHRIPFFALIAVLPICRGAPYFTARAGHGAANADEKRHVQHPLAEELNGLVCCDNIIGIENRYKKTLQAHSYAFELLLDVGIYKLLYNIQCTKAPARVIFRVRRVHL